MQDNAADRGITIGMERKVLRLCEVTCRHSNGQSEIATNIEIWQIACGQVRDWRVRVEHSYKRK